MRKKLQNSKGYAESPEFLPALGLFIQEVLIFKKSVATTSGKLDPYSLDYIFLYTTYVTVFGKTNRLARKTSFFFIALLPLTSSEDAAVQI